MSLALALASTESPTGLEWMPILVSVVVGGAIGLERELHGRPAGLRTHILVCLAASLVVFTARVVPAHLLDGSGEARIVVDPNRLAAGILTGIGFLGAATVIRAGDIVRGITTGATVWTVAGLGVVIGQGHYLVAMAGAGVVLVVLAGLDVVGHHIAPVVYRRVHVSATGGRMEEVSSRISAVLSRNGVRVQDVSGGRGNEESRFDLVFHVRCRNEKQAPKVMEQIASEPGVARVQWSEFGI
jgi:putative Mg2+ transporter-C (MgtC) family protein